MSRWKNATGTTEPSVSRASASKKVFTSALCFWSAASLLLSPASAETMSSALSRAYMGNPDLNQQRASVRATDENLPRALSGFRPTVAATGNAGVQYQDLHESASSAGGSGGSIHSRSLTFPAKRRGELATDAL